MASETKTCTKCGEEKQFEFFGRVNRNKDGRRSSCNSCRKKYYEANRQRITEHSLTYYRENKEHCAKIQKKWREKNKEGIAEYNKKYRVANKEYHLEYSNNYNLKCRNILSPYYIKKLLSQNSVLKFSDIPIKLVEVKRIQMQIERELKKQAV